MSELRKPAWLKSQKLGARKAQEIIHNLRKYKLHTVCESAKCPNQGECFERGTATFMILGEVCTRNCTFCAVEKAISKLLPPDEKEPHSIALLCKELNLKHVVITTVTRDDLPDGGANHFIKTMQEIRKNCENNVTIELLTSDFNGDLDQVEAVAKAGPDVFNHNVETIPRLYSAVRTMADFARSLSVLKKVKDIDPEMLTKSGFMVGLGESKEEIVSLLKQLREIDVDLVTIGQYMAPSRKHYPVQEYVHPDIFKYYQDEGEKMGFAIVESAPLVRSSFQADKARNLIKRSVE
ncbi:MAG: lipoyl synthase [Candidatus Cloacimonetes bacterium]|nr:lipoyl synthase [Candidatus Cloacimonadota bacterium]MCF7812902.1 lipoyl synthase [Candidatus Cloacimonadota bacterium]MCF7867114.1 lipoyl synthase [Candidatus Cloacimonadota bacterium]MCF7882566.1 lipoyl synthase [Candidatus Cloacimonadota bacterium]